jgi:nucleoside-diphosphate-sugar epimerase
MVVRVGILLVGGVGFLGAVMVELSRSRGWGVCVAARRSSVERRLELYERIRAMGAKVLVFEVLGEKAVADSARACGAELIVHLAGSLARGGAVYDAHVRLWREVLEAAASLDLPAIYVSSAAVAPCRPGTVYEEEQHLRGIQADDDYTRSKIEGEKLAMTYHRERGVKASIVRPVVMFGPYAYHPEHKLVLSLARLGLGVTLDIDVVPAIDVAEAVAYIYERGLWGSWFYVARPEGYTMKDLSCSVAERVRGFCLGLGWALKAAAELAKALGRLPPRLELLRRWLKCGWRFKPRRLLEVGFDRWCSLEDAIDQYVSWGLRRWQGS